ncbi:MAG: hypothetical protein ACTHMG_10160 [Sphingomonas sp.]
MADDPDFYRARAAAEHAAAEAATLDNVRVRCERAEAAWTQMADRAERTRRQREEREAATAARVAETLVSGQSAG